MIYRVDHVVAVILAGLIVGALLSRLTSRVEPAQLARGYFVLIVVLIGVTGAISALIRFGVIVALWTWRPRPDEFPGAVRHWFLRAGVGALICLGAAVSGSALMRRVSVPKQAGQAKAFVFGNSDSRHLATVDGEMQVRAAFRGVER